MALSTGSRSIVTYCARRPSTESMPKGTGPSSSVRLWRSSAGRERKRLTSSGSPENSNSTRPGMLRRATATMSWRVASGSTCSTMWEEWTRWATDMGGRCYQTAGPGGLNPASSAPRRQGRRRTLPDRLDDPLGGADVGEAGLGVDGRAVAGEHGFQEAGDLHHDRLGIVDHQGLDVDQLVPVEAGQVGAAPQLLADLAHLELVGPAPDDGAGLGGVVDLDVAVLAGDAGDALGLERRSEERRVGKECR